MNAENRIKGILFASVASFLWGLQVIALKISSVMLSPVNIIWFRFLFAFLLLFLFYLVRKPSHLRIIARPPLFLIVATLGLAGNYLAFLLGVRLIPASNAQVIIQMAPLILGLAGILFYRERIPFRQGIGFLLAGAGLVWFYLENLLELISGRHFYNIGVLWIVISAFSWVIYALFQKNLVRSYPTQQLNLVIFGLPVLIFLPFIQFQSFAELSVKQYIPLVYLGMTTLLAYGSMALAFKYLEASKISIIVAINPVITFIAIGILSSLQVTWIEPERFSLLGIFSAVVVITGAVLAVANPKRYKTIDHG
jgi:drug/metabolite transporter (DMT)-like permease